MSKSAVTLKHTTVTKRLKLPVTQQSYIRGTKVKQVREGSGDMLRNICENQQIIINIGSVKADCCVAFY